MDLKRDVCAFQGCGLPSRHTYTNQLDHHITLGLNTKKQKIFF